MTGEWFNEPTSIMIEIPAHSRRALLGPPILTHLQENRARIGSESMCKHARMAGANLERVDPFEAAERWSEYMGGALRA